MSEEQMPACRHRQVLVPFYFALKPLYLSRLSLDYAEKVFRIVFALPPLLRVPRLSRWERGWGEVVFRIKVPSELFRLSQILSFC